MSGDEHARSLARALENLMKHHVEYRSACVRLFRRQAITIIALSLFLMVHLVVDVVARWWP